MSDKGITGEEIKRIIAELAESPEKCGFEVNVITKTEPKLKKMQFYEGKKDEFRLKLKSSILRVLNDKYNSDEADYVGADRIADEQKKFYIIDTDDGYSPFDFLKSDTSVFSKNDISEATGIAYSLRMNEIQLWAYQHLWGILVPNKSNKNSMARLISSKEGDVFEELREPLITFTEKVDLLVIDSYIIASDYKLMQNVFGFQDYIRIKADRTIKAIEEKGIVANIEKLREYTRRGNGKTRYAKKLMRIHDSKVLKMEPSLLWGNIHKSKRWNGKIKEVDGKFVLDTYVQVENLIDLFDERYTRSDITDVEYDTDVKIVAEMDED